VLFIDEICPLHTGDIPFFNSAAFGDPINHPRTRTARFLGEKLFGIFTVVASEKVLRFSFTRLRFLDALVGTTQNFIKNALHEKRICNFLVAIIRVDIFLR